MEKPGKRVRNPRPARITVSLTADIERRVEELADRMGQSKSVTTGMLLGLGLNMLEMATIPGKAQAAMATPSPEQEKLTDNIAENLAPDVLAVVRTQEREQEE